MWKTKNLIEKKDQKGTGVKNWKYRRMKKLKNANENIYYIRWKWIL